MGVKVFSNKGSNVVFLKRGTSNGGRRSVVAFAFNAPQPESPIKTDKIKNEKREERTLLIDGFGIVR